MLGTRSARQGLCESLTGFSKDREATFEPITPDWWQWDGANPQNQVWNKDYVVSGKFTNKGGTQIQDLSITIFEDNANVSNTPFGLVTPSQTVPGATSSIKKDWGWFIAGAWVVKGPLHKDFHYRASISAKDASGTPYPVTTTADLLVIVNVSKLKRTAGAYAMGTAIAAAGMAASIVLIEAAAFAYAAAAIAGAVALDPPVPDPNFRARISLPRLGSVPKTGDQRAIIRFFRLGERVMRLELTKSLIEGRRLGAVNAGNQEWIDTHARDIEAATSLQLRVIKEANDLADEARRQAAALVPPGTDLRTARLSQQASGLPPSLAARLKLPKVQRAGFDALLQSDAALPNPDIARAIDDAASSLLALAEALRD
jgi:hypothetical protein